MVSVVCIKLQHTHYVYPTTQFQSPIQILHYHGCQDKIWEYSGPKKILQNNSDKREKGEKFEGGTFKWLSVMRHEDGEPIDMRTPHEEEETGKIH
jgi:hypothetical protein